METYKFERETYYDQVEIGDVVEVDGESIKVISILKVDFRNDIVWFTGVKESKLD